MFFDFSNPQFWVAVSFFIFILVIFNPVRKILITSLDYQINEIKNKIEEAGKIKDDAQKTLAELKERETQVEKEIQNLKKNSEKRISQLKDLSSKKLLEQIEKRKLLAENKIEQIVRETNLSIKNYITNVAVEASIHILNNNLSAEKKAELVNESIKDLNVVLNN